MNKKQIKNCALYTRVSTDNQAEKELTKAEKELEKGRPDKAVMRLSKSWLHSQLAIKFATLKE